MKNNQEKKNNELKLSKVNDKRFKKKKRKNFVILNKVIALKVEIMVIEKFFSV
jgi:hypothetical protein